MDSTAQTSTRSGRIPKKTFKVRENNVFTPIPLVPPPTIAKGLFAHPHPQFEPSKRVPFDSMQVLVPIVSALQLFLLLLGEASLAAMVTATNANAAKDWHYDDSFRYQRPWHPLTRNELIRWLGTLVYMGRHHETNKEYYWREDMHLKLSRAMSKKRWEQIHRFFKINDSEDGIRTLEQPWFYKLEPLMTTIRQNIQNAVEPASWLAVDELMVAFQGRSAHTIKIKNKPISEGFKFWCIGFNGYIFTWRCHSGPESSEGMIKSRRYQQIGDRGTVPFAPTHQVPMVLCQHVRDLFPEQQYLVFLDNLFLNVHVAHCLLEIGFFVMGSTRKNAKGVPKEILAIKNQGKKNKKKKDDDSDNDDGREPPAKSVATLVYNSLVAMIVGWCLVFVWQDNNAVLAITTAHSVHRKDDDTVDRLRRRPKATSTNAAMSWPVFEGQATKWLRIPKAIDDYNQGMNGVDNASQLRGGFSVHQPGENKWWRPIFYFLIDICCNNAYLIWKTRWSPKNHKLHQLFEEELETQLLQYNLHAPAPGNVFEHQRESLPMKRQCAYGLKVKGGCVQGGTPRGVKRTVLGEIKPNARLNPKPREVRWGCKQCQVALCKEGMCWSRYHSTE